MLMHAEAPALAWCLVFWVGERRIFGDQHQAADNSDAGLFTHGDDNSRPAWSSRYLDYCTTSPDGSGT